MSPGDRISAAIRAAAQRGQPAFVAYMTAGFPTRERFRSDLKTIASAADVVEIGVPFTDPMADGVTIQRSSLASLSQGTTLRWILAELEAMPRLDTPILLMSYLNPLLALGIGKIPEMLVRANVSGVIVPDLPLDESGELRAALDGKGLAVVQMVTPVTEPERLAQLCEASRGFIYAVTMTGTTGKNLAVPQAVPEYLDRVRKLAKVPVCAGFGIRSRDQVQRLAGHVDGVVIGSALVEVLERDEDPAAWLNALRAPGGR